MCVVAQDLQAPPQLSLFRAAILHEDSLQEFP